MNQRLRSQHRSLIALVFVATLLVFGIAFWTLSGDALATGATNSSVQSQATVATGGGANAPAAIQTSAPGAVGTSGPGAVGTAGPSSIGPSDSGSPNQPGNNPSTTGTASSSSFPWLALVILAIVVVLGIIAFFLARSRRMAVDTAGAGTYTPAPRTTTSTTARGPYMGGGVASTNRTATTAATTAAAAAPSAPLPATIECPNCGTVNRFDENFCHECGQDLRPTRAKIVAAATPAPVAAPPQAPVQEVVSDDTPYLETQDRTDEQLEYVLARPVVRIGTAANNDIVIDSSFTGWEAVAPVHLELRNDQEGFTVVDQGSESGTYVNGTRTGENMLADGDVLRLGQSGPRFVFRNPLANQ